MPEFTPDIAALRVEQMNAARQRNAAHRAVDDPAQLARAARIVRAALARQRLQLADLTPMPASSKSAAG